MTGPNKSLAEVSADEFFTVETLTRAAINDAIDDHTHVLLKPGATYTGETTITYDPTTNGRTDGYVMAYSAHIEHATSGVLIDALKNSAQGFEGTLTWEGGQIDGGASITADSTVFRVTDHYGADIHLSRVTDVDRVGHIRNVDDFSEQGRFDVTRAAQVNEGLVFDGATQTGGSGTDSFRGTEVDGLYNANSRAILQRDADLYGADINAHLNIAADNGVAWEIDGGNMRSTVVDAVFEASGSPSNATALQITSIDTTPQQFVAEFGAGYATNFDNASNSTVRVDVQGVDDGPEHRMGVAGTKTTYETWADDDGTHRLSLAAGGTDAPRVDIEQSGTDLLVWNVTENAAGTVRPGAASFAPRSDAPAMPGNRAGFWVDSSTGQLRVRAGNTNVANFYRDQSRDLPEQDLSGSGLGAAEDGREYRHNGANPINADGGTTSSPGYYVWDNSAGEFKSIVQF